MSKNTPNEKSLGELHEQLVSVRTAQAGTADDEEHAILQSGAAQLALDIQEKAVQELDRKTQSILRNASLALPGILIIDWALLRFWTGLLPYAFVAQIIVQSILVLYSLFVGRKLKTVQHRFESQKQQILDKEE